MIYQISQNIKPKSVCSNMWEVSLRQKFMISGVFYKYQDSLYKRVLRSMEGPWWANDSEFYSYEQLQDMMVWALDHGVMLSKYGVLYNGQMTHPVIALTTHGENTSKLLFNEGVDQVVLRVFRTLDGSITMRDEANRDVVESVALNNLLYSMVMEAKLAKLGRLYYVSGTPRLKAGIEFTYWGMNRVYGSVGNMVADMTALLRAEQQVASAEMIKNGIKILKVERSALMTRQDGAWVNDKMRAIGVKDAEMMSDESVIASARHNILTPDGIFARKFNAFAEESDLDMGVGKIFSEELAYHYGVNIRTRNWEELAGLLDTNATSVRRVAKRDGVYKTFVKLV